MASFPISTGKWIWTKVGKFTRAKFLFLCRLPNEDEAISTIKEAIVRGINFIDTAYWYGQGTAEKILGKALKDIPRNTYYIGTKVGRYELAEKDRFDFSAKATRESVLRSLDHLGLDYVDVIQIHDIEFAPSFDILLNETLPTLEELVKEGKANYIGVTCYPLDTLRKFIEAVPGRIQICLTYSRYNMIDDSLLEYLDFFKEHEIGVICASGHAMGLLTNDGPQPWHPAEDDIKSACREAAELCKANGIELARLAMDQFVRVDGVATFLSGMQNSGQLTDNLNVYLGGLSDEEQSMKLRIIESIFSKLKTKHWEGVEVAAYRKKIGAWEELKKDAIKFHFPYFASVFLGTTD